MSIITDVVDPKTGRYQSNSAKVRTAGKNPAEDKKSLYNPTEEERDIINSFLKDFRNG